MSLVLLWRLHARRGLERVSVWCCSLAQLHRMHFILLQRSTVVSSGNLCLSRFTQSNHLQQGSEVMWCSRFVCLYVCEHDNSKVVDGWEWRNEVVWSIHVWFTHSACYFRSLNWPCIVVFWITWLFQHHTVSLIGRLNSVCALTIVCAFLFSLS